jgi:PAS domain S-box-containing protein
MVLNHSLLYENHIDFYKNVVSSPKLSEVVFICFCNFQVLLLGNVFHRILMAGQKNNNENSDKIKKLEARLSELKFELEEARTLLEEEQNQRQFYQFVAEFTFGWELWFEQGGKIKYCSPSCFDLTGFTSNQVIASGNIAELLVYEADREKFDIFLKESLDQQLMNQSLEFRILTRHKQLRWFSMNIRGVYNKQGRYLGVRASINDVTRLKKAMGQIQELSEGKEIESRVKLRIKSQLDDKERELVSFLLQLSQKNELISLVSKKLKKIAAGNTKNAQEKVPLLLEILESVPVSPVNWESVESELENLHPGFLNRLQVKHPNLTPKGKRLCAYMRLGLSSKEIAGLQNITYKSVEIARVRLRKKLKMKQEIRLSNYLLQL